MRKFFSEHPRRYFSVSDEELKYKEEKQTNGEAVPGSELGLRELL